MEQIICSSCGAPLQTENKSNIFHCSYCGSKFIFSCKREKRRPFVQNKKSIFDLCCEEEADWNEIQDTLKLFYNKKQTWYYEFYDNEDDVNKHITVVLNNKLLGYVPDEYVDDFEWYLKTYDDDYDISHQITKDANGIYKCAIEIIWGSELW